MYNLKVKTTGGSPFFFNGKVNGATTLSDLKTKLFELTCIPTHKQKILIGFPPRPLTGSNEDNLQTLGIKNGEVIIVEELSKASLEENKRTESHDKSNSALPVMERRDARFPRGTLLKKIVPSDNSCLFASIYYLMNGGDIILEELHNIRCIVADTLRQNKHIYNEALLERSNEDYCKWILKETSWGGGIELAVLSEYYQVEIVTVDAKCGIVNRFGEDKLHENRIFLMYDGIHYDALHLETYDGRILYVFPTTEHWLLEQAHEIACQAKNSGQFTDTQKFRLKCNQCGFLMQGQDQALRHAKTTSHSDFEEVKNIH